MLCPHCKFIVNVRHVWQRFSNGTLHIRAECTRPECGKFIMYVPQSPKAMESAGDPPPEPVQGATLFD